MKLEFEIAKTILKDHSGKRLKSMRFRSAFLGILLASLGLFLGGALMGGYHQTFQQAVLNFNAHITIKPYKGYLFEKQAEDVIRVLEEKQSEYSLVYTPFLYWESLVQTQDGMQAVVLKGIDLSLLKTMYPFSFQSVENQSSNGPSVYLGKNLYNKLYPSAKADFRVSFLQNQKFKQQLLNIQATFHIGIEPYDSEFILMDWLELQNQIIKPDVSFILGYELRLDKSADIHALAQELKAELGESYSIQSWDEINSSLLNGLMLEKITFMAVGGCILAIACLNIFGFNLMVFLQNKQTFRVLYHLGLSQKRLQKLFMGLSLFVGLSASFVGYVLARALMFWINQQNGFSIQLEGLPPLVLKAVWDTTSVVLFFAITAVMALLASFIALRSIFKTQSHV